ncbi:MAG: hypothetical protein ACOYO1_13000 [Bacteroidales bacterium]
MTKIIFYAHRVSFISNWIIPLKNYLNAEVIVFHINALHKENIPECNGIQLIDISNLSLRKILLLIKEINPGLYITLGYNSVMELLLSRVFKFLQIKTLYLEHGLFTKDTISDQSDLIKAGMKKESIRKNVNFIIKYTGFLLVSKNLLKEAKIFLNAGLYKDYTQAKYDKAFFFGEYGFKNLNRLFNYSQDEIVYCGYPLFKSNEEIMNLGSEPLVKNTKDVIYVHQTFILNNQAYISYEDELKFINNIWAQLKDSYDQFFLLLHPRENLDKYINLYKSTGIKVIQAPNNYKVFIGKDLVIGHYSTALLYALFFKIKTIIINYPNTEIDKLFKDYCLFCENPNELKPFLSIKNPENLFLPSQNLLGTENNYEHISSLIYNLL